MPRKQTRLVRGDAAVQAYARRLTDRACRIYLPEVLAAQEPTALYRVENREGLTTVAVRRADLTDEQVRAILTYRLGQYLHPAVNIVDPRLVHDAHLEHEPADRETARDVHFLCGDAQTGHLLCYATLRAVPDAPEGATLADEDRPLLPIETVHGQGLFNRLDYLPQLPLRSVYELGRYVKNQGLHPLNERSARAPTEVALAVFRTLLGPLRDEVRGFVGDLEINVAKQTLDFFHIPVVLVRGVIPYSPEHSYFYPRNQNNTIYPFAALTEDVTPAEPRIDAIEAALNQSGKASLRLLFALKRTAASPRSSLQPAAGLPALATEEVPEQGGDMAHRREVMEVAEELRAFDPFRGLSEAERRLLGGFMEREEYPTGQIVIRQGDEGRDLFLIEHGSVEVLVDTEDFTDLPVATLEAGNYFGEMGLLHGGRRTADVVATTPLTILRLTKASYQRFLARLDEVEGRIQRMARRRARQTAARVRDAKEPASEA